MTAESENWLRGLLPFVVMCVGMFIALLDIQIVASSLQNIGGGLSAAQDEISWVQTGYLIAEIVIIPLSGWLTRVFSTRWLFAASAAGFTVASLAPATGAVFSVLPAENATGNFTKIVQRVPVRILLDGDAGVLGRLRPGLSVTAAVDEKAQETAP